MTKSQSSRQHASRNDVIKLGPDMSVELAFAGAQHARSDQQRRRYGMVDSQGDDADWLKRRCRQARQYSRKQLVQSVADAYEAYCWVKNNPSLAHTVLVVAKGEGIKRNSRTTILRLLIELHVSYGEDGTDREAVARARNNYSRNEKAIEHLIARNILPDSVVALAQQRQEGLDKWVRGERPNKKKRKPRKDRPSTLEMLKDEINQGAPGNYNITWATPSGTKFTVVINEKIAKVTSAMIDMLVGCLKVGADLSTSSKPQRSQRL